MVIIIIKIGIYITKVMTLHLNDYQVKMDVNQDYI